MNGISFLATLLRETFTEPKAAKERVARSIARDIVEERWRPILTLTFVHAIGTYVLMALAGEVALVENWVRFAYYYVTTGSTIGYGDLSPSTTLGYVFFILWVCPGALLVFGYLLTKVAASFTFFMRNHMSGQGSFQNTRDHLIIIGYVAGQTEQLIAETSAAHQGKEIVIVTVLESLPLPDRINRVRTTSLASADDLVRAGIHGACSVVIMASTDEDTMSACLAVGALKPSAHVVAFFRDEKRAELVRPHCSKFEYVVSTSVQQVGRAITDPGASIAIKHIVSSKIGDTIALIDYTGPDTTIQEVRKQLKSLNAGLFGYCYVADPTPIFIFEEDTRIGAEHRLIYIAKKRLPDNALAA